MQPPRGPTLWQELDAHCATAARGLAPYPWPLRPFNSQHPIRGYFGDPRTVFYGVHEGLFSFHNGVDISAWAGNRVYPVASGRVVRLVGDEIVIASSHDRRFQYIHVRPRVHLGQRVLASRTVVGEVFEPWEHVHLSELRAGCVINPLAPGHLSPYVDHTTPTVGAVRFESRGIPIPRRDLRGTVDVIAQAWDEPAMSTPGVWRRMPVAPALVTWQISTLRGRTLLAGVAADFRLTEPPPEAFCAVYAPGTRQNFAVEHDHYSWGRAGNYRYQLVPSLDTDRFRNGRYRLTVTVADTAGNSSRRAVEFAVRNRGPTAQLPRPDDWRCRQRALVEREPPARSDELGPTR